MTRYRLQCQLHVSSLWRCIQKINRLAQLSAMVLFIGLGVIIASTQNSMAEDKGVFRDRSINLASDDQGSSSQAQKMKTGDLYALVVGVSDYENPNVGDLNCSAGDAKAFGEFLETQRQVFKETHVHVLTNAQANKREIEKLLQYELLKAGKDDTVALFFSGHGSGDPKKPGEYFFLGCDADPKFLQSTAVKLSGLKFLHGLDAKRVVLIVDACHAGGATKYDKIALKSVEKSLSAFVREFEESSGKVILTSSQAHEYSQEKPGLDRSVFTHYLLKALKGEADANRDGVVTLRETYGYVYDRTKDETEGAQKPQLEGSLVGSFPMAMVRPLDNSIKLEVRFVAQDPACDNKSCIDPPSPDYVCEDSKCRDITINDGATMYSGQNYQIAVRPSETSYIYVYQIGSKGDVVKLFPGKDFLAPGSKMENPLKGGQIHWIPGKYNWLKQDYTLGEEKIFVVASRSRNEILEDLYSHVERLRREGAVKQTVETVSKKIEEELLMMPSKVTTKAVYREKPTPDDPKVHNFELYSKIFEAPGLDVVKSVWFHHKNR